jgi:hypothetical protein
MWAAILVIVSNITLLIIFGSQTSDDVLKYSAWVLSFIWIVSVINTIVTKVFGRK